MTKRKREKSMPEKAYSVFQVAKRLDVDRQTVFKWLSLNYPEDAVIPLSGWFRLPGGHIRIREGVVIKLLESIK